MANPHRGFVTIEIGGEEYILRLDFNAIATADKMLEMSLLRALASGRFDAIQTAIVVGLRNGHNARGAAQEAVKNLDARRRDYYLECILEALEASGVIDPEREEGDPGEAPASTRGKKDAGPSTTEN